MTVAFCTPGVPVPQDTAPSRGTSNTQATEVSSAQGRWNFMPFPIWLRVSRRYPGGGIARCPLTASISCGILALSQVCVTTNGVWAVHNGSRPLPKPLRCGKIGLGGSSSGKPLDGERLKSTARLRITGILIRSFRPTRPIQSRRHEVCLAGRCVPASG